jgi:hypothetical protein
MPRLFVTTVTLLAAAVVMQSADPCQAEPQLLGHWKLQGDCRDSSGHENHGANHGVDLTHGLFDGADDFIEVPMSDSMRLGTSDFTICVWINTPKQLDDIVGDVLDLYDPQQRRGVTLTIDATAGGYQSQGTDRHVHFGIDNARDGEWIDCGRPNPTSNYVSNSLTVFDGHLYAATMDAQDEKDWAHVYRYEGDGKWADCGRVGEGRTTGVGPLIVHDGELYAATTTYDWTRVREGDYDPGRVYRYLGGTKWEDLGPVSDNRTLNTMASYRGKLYVAGGPLQWGVYVHEEGQWKPSKLFPMDGPQRLFPHTMCRHNGKLFVGWPGVYAFDGVEWRYAGDPLSQADRPGGLQTHSMELHQGKLVAGAWPEAYATVYEGGETWRSIGRIGEDGTEVNSLVVYNGKLYGGSLPRSEVCRYDGADVWTSIKRFYSPEGWTPGIPGQANREEVKQWSRITSMSVYDGKLFASTGSCTSSVLDAPCDVRGKVFSMEAGKMASYDKDLGPGWKHLAAVKKGGRLALYIDGQPVAESGDFVPAEYDLSIDQPLRIGIGQSEHFDGRMADVRLYRGALDEPAIAELSGTRPE